MTQATLNRRTRGHKARPLAALQALHAAAFARHGHRNRYLPHALPAQYDLVALGLTIPIQDQGQCGSCWDVSHCGVVSDSFIKAGLQKNDGSFILSPQYVLDCGNNGGCNGDDGPTVLDMAKSKGLPTAADYGPYTANPGRCGYTNQKLYQIQDWAFCTGDQSMGIATVQEIKNALLAYGTIGTAIAADSTWDNVGSDGVLPFENGGSVDHDVAIVGWDDTKSIPGAKSPGAWKIKNQWGANWAASGYCWVGYGSHQSGTEAAYVILGVTPPPAPTPPNPPPGPSPLPPAPQTFTINVPIQPVYVGSIPVGYVPAYTLTGTIQPAGHAAAQLGPIIQLLEDLCAVSASLPLPPAVQSWVAGICALLPQAKAGIANGQGGLWLVVLLDVIKIGCANIALLAQYPQIYAIASQLCGFVPNAAAAPCGCH